MPEARGITNLRTVVTAKVQMVHGEINRDIAAQSANAVGATIIRLCRERTMAGVDIWGRPFAEYSPAYAGWKARWIAGTPSKKGRGRRKATSKKAAPRKGGDFAADRMPSFMRLTGRMFRAMKYAVVAKGKIGSELTVKVAFHIAGKEAQELATYHNVLGAGRRKVKRRFWGPLSAPGTPRRAQEDRVVLRIIKDTARLSLNRQGVVYQEKS